MAEIKLFKKETSYADRQTGEARQATRFYVQCGDALIPIQVTYFENPETGKDAQYASRKAILKAFANELPEKDGNAHG
jgi:hypothetical protein